MWQTADSEFIHQEWSYAVSERKPREMSVGEVWWQIQDFNVLKPFEVVFTVATTQLATSPAKSAGMGAVLTLRPQSMLGS